MNKSPVWFLTHRTPCPFQNVQGLISIWVKWDLLFTLRNLLVRVHECVSVHISSVLQLCCVSLAVGLGMCREALQCCTARGEGCRERRPPRALRYRRRHPVSWEHSEDKKCVCSPLLQPRIMKRPLGLRSLILMSMSVTYEDTEKLLSAGALSLNSSSGCVNVFVLRFLS